MTRITDALANFNDITEEVVEVPEWAEVGVNKIAVRSMTGTARAELLKEAIDPDTGDADFAKLYPQIIIATAYDPDDGTPAFGSEHAEFINARNARATERLAMAGMRLSGLSEKAADKTAESFPDGEE